MPGLGAQTVDHIRQKSHKKLKTADVGHAGICMQAAGRGRKRKQQAVETHDSPASWQERGEGSKVLAEAGMILRDPSALHLLIKQVPHHMS